MSFVTQQSTSAHPWVVLKFGGTSVATAARWKSIVTLAKKRRDEGFRPVVVVSALSGVTNLLLKIIDAGNNPAAAKTIADEIRARHQVLIEDLAIALPTGTAAWLDRLDALTLDARAVHSALDWQAEVLAIGELCSSSLGAALFTQHGLPAAWLDSRDWLCAIEPVHQSDWARWLSVSCSTEGLPDQAALLAATADAFVAPGFIARNLSGATVILGRGGSDTSAAYLGAILGAARVEIWTDVAGMFSADPRQVPNARLLARLDFEEAQEIATTGAKVLHPRSLAPVRDAGVPMWIRDTNRPDLEGTIIEARVADGSASVKAISARRGVMLVAMESLGMWQQVGFLADVFAAFKQHGLSVDLISSAETNVTVSLDPTENLVNTNVLEALCADLAAVCRVKLIGPCAAITLVGRGMRGLLANLSGVWSEFGTMPVHLISQSSNNLNLTFVVDESAAEGLVARIHDSLIRTRALKGENQSVFGPSWKSLYQADEEITEKPWWVHKRSRLLELACERTPRYVYDRDTLRARARALLAIDAVDQWFYATKANAHPAILTELANLGFGLESVSEGEFAHAHSIAPAAAKLYTSNFAATAELRRMIGERTAITIDNLTLLQAHPDIFSGRDLLLRVDLGVGRGHHDKVKTGGAGSKFGIALSDLGAAHAAAERASARVIGLHAHLGSGILSVAHFREVYAELAAIGESISSVSIVNIGGGIGVPARSEDPVIDLAELARALAEVKAAYPQFQLWMEPGRFLVAEAGVLLATVTQTKTKDETHFVGLDAGMHNLIRPALYDAWHPIVNLTRLDEPTTETVRVVGPICESSDVLGIDRRLPRSSEGDVVLIAHAGAYGAVMASNYNRRAHADEVML
ncbi:MAG: bifunctional aspartate kinase/diaminopimelate decarboxylase [Pseudomonadota bacterium]|nr:bifunctional aspartate kinase/diaminopimelate decarboxylase [Pseudomonadota bacterium]